MQRLFSSFPDGRPGVGLVIVRIALVAAMLLDVERALGLPLALLLVAGFMTPAAGVAAAVAAMFHGAPNAVALGFAVALLGPGAYSVDARLFGRREIVVD